WDARQIDRQCGPMPLLTSVLEAVGSVKNQFRNDGEIVRGDRDGDMVVHLGIDPSQLQRVATIAVDTKNVPVRQSGGDDESTGWGGCIYTQGCGIMRTHGSTLLP